MISLSGRHCLFILLLLVILTSPLHAHFNVILPMEYEQWQADKGDEVKCRIVWGHGYEHLWMNAIEPVVLAVHAPSGKITDLKASLKPTEILSADGRKSRSFIFNWKPEERGDYILALKAALIWDDDEGVFLQDYAKSVLHVQDKLGWDRALGHDLELVPLTRPYALPPGGIVQMQLLSKGKPLPGCPVEIELLNSRIPAPESIPGEEFITREAKTDPNGVVSFGLGNIGITGVAWYALTAIHETGETREQEGHKGPLIERATFWINVVPQNPPPAIVPQIVPGSEGESGVEEKPAIERCY